MILQALYELAQNEKLIGDPDFESKPIRWLVEVGPGGKFSGLTDTNFIPPADEVGSKAKRPKPQAKTFNVPLDPGMKSRTSGSYPGPLFDKGDYLFGWAIDEKDRTDKGRSKMEARRALFLERARSVAEATRDEGVCAVVAFLTQVAAGNVPDIPADCAPGDLFAFVYGPDIDRLVTDRPAVRAWWKSQRALPSAGGLEMQCLVTGKRFSDPDLFPKIKRVPGVAGDTSLVSYNAGAFLSYGLKSNENAPVSRDAAESIATALNRLLHPAYPVPGRNPPTLKSRMFRIADDTGFCYWSRNPDSAFANSLDDLLSVTSESVREEVWQRLWRGRPPEGTVDLTPFYGLVITGTTGRAILREWFETTVGEAQKSVADHFHDLALVRNAPWKKGEDPPPAIGIRTLLESIAEQGDLGNVPRVLASQFLRAALTGCLYPFGILTRAVERARAEIGNDDWAGLQRRDARAAIIKAVLNRRHRLQPRPNSTEVHEEMDPHNTNPGYVLGCLIAVLERLQQEALGDVNASVIDKYFAGASAAPRATFDRLVKNARHHAKKAKDGDNPGIVMRLEKLIDELISSINVDHKLSQKAYRPIGFPLTLPIEQQGLFVIGYHHMRHFLWLNAERRAEWEASHPSAAPAYLWQSKKTTSAAA